MEEKEGEHEGEKPEARPAQGDDPTTAAIAVGEARVRPRGQTRISANTGVQRKTRISLNSTIQR